MITLIFIEVLKLTNMEKNEYAKEDLNRKGITKNPMKKIY